MYQQLWYFLILCQITCHYVSYLYSIMLADGKNLFLINMSFICMGSSVPRGGSRKLSIEGKFSFSPQKWPIMYAERANFFSNLRVYSSNLHFKQFHYVFISFFFQFENQFWKQAQLYLQNASHTKIYFYL